MNILGAKAQPTMGSLGPYLYIHVDELPDYHEFEYRQIWNSNGNSYIIVTENDDGYFHAIWVDLHDPTGAINGSYHLKEDGLLTVIGGWHGSSTDINQRIDELGLSGPVMECVYFEQPNPHSRIGQTGWITVEKALELVDKYIPEHVLTTMDEKGWEHFWRLKHESEVSIR